jgi:PBSX family phage terminase large subunit
MFKPTKRQREATELLNKDDTTRVLLYGGSRSGKTVLLIFIIFLRAIKKKSRHVIFRYRYSHAKTSLWYDTIPKLISTTFKDVPLKMNKQDLFVEFENGSTIWIAGLDDKERTEKILGNEYSTIYFNEASQINYDSILMALTRLAENSGLVNKIYFDCNPPSSQHWVYKMFIKKQDPKTNMALDNQYVCLRMNPIDNPYLPKDYIDSTLNNLPDRLKRRFLYGEFVDDIEGALWQQTLIDKYRVMQLPELKKIYIGVDPATTSNKDSDETGIIIGGIGHDGHGYIYKDITGTYTPDQWAKRILTTYYKEQADKVIAETNQGGEMVETILRQYDSNVSYKGVHATRGKVIRAEPILSLYEQGKIHHVGSLPELENEMTTWVPGESKSPNRIDAMVWLMTFLFIKNTVYEDWAI